MERDKEKIKKWVRERERERTENEKDKERGGEKQGLDNKGERKREITKTVFDLT